MFLWFMQPDIWLTLITLTFLEIILGVDNIIFLSLVVAKQLFLGWIILFFFHWWWQNFRYHNKIWRVNWV